MNCDISPGHVAAYADGELDGPERDAFRLHLQQCPLCAARALALTEEKAAIRNAGMRYTASPALRERIMAEVRLRKSPSAGSRWGVSPALFPRLAWIASAAAVLLLAIGLYLVSLRNTESKSLAEFADLHVTALAGGNPVEVVSSDKHTVKPWFQGKIPFTFDVPELNGTPFKIGRAHV